MVGNVVRKNISLPKELIEMINAYCEKTGISFSEFLRQAALEKFERMKIFEISI